MNKATGASVYYRVAEKLFENLSHEKVWGAEGIAPLKRFKEGETAYITMCPNPKHTGARQSFMLPKAWPGGSCRMCGHRSNWLTTAVKKAGGSFQGGVALLASTAGVDVSALGIADSDWREMEVTWKKLTVFGALSYFFSKVLQRSEAPGAKAAKAYFKEAGITERALMAFPVGYYPSSNEVRQYLEKSDVRKDFIEAAGVFSDTLQSNYPFLFGFSDAQGNVTGFMGTEPGNPNKRMPLPGFTEDLQNMSLFGIEEATPMITSERSVWMASPEIDTISIQHESNKTFKIFKQMVSLGVGLKPAKPKLAALRKLGAEHIIFSTPMTPEGRKLTTDFAGIICELGIKGDVLPLPEGISSLRHLIAERGYDYFDKSMVSHSGIYSIGRWLGKELVNRYDLSDEAGAAKAKEAAARASLELAAEDAKEFVYEIGDRLKWDPHFWCIVLEQCGKKDLAEVSEQQVRDVLSQLETKRKDDLEMGFSWSVTTEDLEEVTVVTVSEDELMHSFYNPRDVLEQYESSRKGLSTGLDALDDCVGLRPGEMTMVCGLPGSGKTTFCVNLISHILHNDDEAVLFFTLENTRMTVFNMLISNTFEIPFNQILEKRLEVGESMYQKYLTAVEEFTRYRDKLVVIEEPFHTRYAASDIQEICQMMSGNVPIGLIVVDSLGMLSWDKTTPIENETQLGYVARELLDTAKRVNAPLVVTNTPWVEHIRIEGGDLAETPLSVSLRVEPYASTILNLHYHPYSATGELGASRHAVDRLLVSVQKNSMGKKPVAHLEFGVDATLRKLINLNE
ncbi:MAG: hypothetical protein JW759_10060 [Candidatus Coatesbacteria bacterium]|nr:hypothetical protein [Candidatus Coatesbacteria bacterium]